MSEITFEERRELVRDTADRILKEAREIDFRKRQLLESLSISLRLLSEDEWEQIRESEEDGMIDFIDDVENAVWDIPRALSYKSNDSVSGESFRWWKASTC